METAPSLLIVSNKINIFLARLITRCACWVIVRCSLSPQVSRNVQHDNGTRRGSSSLHSLWMFRFGSCIFFPWDSHWFWIWNLGHHSGSWTESRMKLCLCQEGSKKKTSNWVDLGFFSPLQVFMHAQRRLRADKCHCCWL